MKFISTRDSENFVNFEKAVLNCIPGDGGFFIPEDFVDLRRWILYTDEKTTFSSIAGALTSACINEEFSPIICETIAVKAFPFEPVLKKIDDRLFTLELFHTPTGSHKDFGISYLVNSLETILTMKDEKAVFLDATVGELGASLACSLRGKKNLKAVLVYPKGTVRGLDESDLIWNGGNVLPVEVDGNESYCHELVRKIFADKNIVEKFNLTVANTANIGRLLPQMFFYPYAFSRLKKQVCGDIYYALSPGNYSNLVAGLYAWRLSLPVNGFICPATDELKVDLLGRLSVMDSLVDFKNRDFSDFASPSNLERLESIFSSNSLMLKNFVFPAEISSSEADDACRQLFMKYHIFADRATSNAYASVMSRKMLTDEDDASVVLIMRDHPAFSADYIRHTVGECPEIPDNVKKSLQKTELNRKFVTTSEEIICLLDLVK